MPRYELAIFDLDGTLADTKLDLAAATNHTLRELGFETFPADVIATFVGGGLTRLLARALGPRAEDPSLLEKARQVFVPYYREHMLDATRPYDGIDRMLSDLRNRSVRLAVATNKPRIFTAGIIDRLFGDVFDPVVACGDDAPRKPDPMCVEICRKRYPAVAAERILFVGDSVVDVETARAAVVDVASCTWGYGDRAALTAERPRWLVDDVAALRAVLLGTEGGAVPPT